MGLGPGLGECCGPGAGVEECRGRGVGVGECRGPGVGVGECFGPGVGWLWPGGSLTLAGSTTRARHEQSEMISRM